MSIKQQNQPAQAESALLDVAECAALFKVKVSTIRAWVLHKRIPYVKLGGKLVRFRRADVEKVISSRVISVENQLSGAAQ
jgi:excisionase family DNA binding protein